MSKNSEKTQAELYREQRKARLAKAAAKNAKKTNKITIGKGGKATIAVVIVIAIVAGIAGYIASATGLKYKKTDVVTVGDGIASVSAAEYSYYYNTAFNYYFQNSYQIESYYGAGSGVIYTGYDYKVLPGEQKYTAEKIEGIEEPTWADFFAKSAKESIIQIKALVKLAKDAGVELSDEDIAGVEEQLESVKESASEQNYSVSAYLQMYYGKGVTKSLAKSIMLEQTLASKYQELKNEEFGKSKTDKEIKAVYKEDSDSYDKVNVSYYLVKAEEVKSTDEDGEETSAVTAKTMSKAKETADKISEAATLKDFEKAVKSAGGSVSSTGVADYETVSGFNGDIASWIYGKGVKTGDTTVIEDEDTGYYVCYAVAAPYRDDTAPVNVRHILLKFAEDKAETEDADTQEETTEAVEETKIEASEGLPELSEFKDAPVFSTVSAKTAKQADKYNEAEILLREYLNGDKTEESFSALAKEYSEDTASTTQSQTDDQGGLYEAVTVGQMVPEFNDWCFDKNRKAGDVGIVETSYGYHIMYFVSAQEEPLWKSTIRTSLASADFDAFVEDITNDETYKLTVINEKYMDDVAEQTESLAQRFIYNINNSQNLAY